MNNKFCLNLIITTITSFGLLTVLSTSTLANERPGDNHHGRQAAGQMASAAHGHAGGGHDHNAEQKHHVHESWITPPEEYAGKQSTKWADLAAIERGKAIYQQQCVACHGADGQGGGPISKSLAHLPADLTNHSHERPGDGDAYLFWRVSKGGTVEPFRSQGSAMPAFEAVLNEEERWDVLAYVHSFFHLGLDDWKPAVADEPSSPPYASR